MNLQSSLSNWCVESSLNTVNPQESDMSAKVEEFHKLRLGIVYNWEGGGLAAEQFEQQKARIILGKKNFQVHLIQNPSNCFTRIFFKYILSHCIY